MPRAAPVISAVSPQPFHEIRSPFASKRCSFSVGVSQTVVAVMRIRPRRRAHGHRFRNAVAVTWKKVSEPRCSDTPTLPCQCPPRARCDVLGPDADGVASWAAAIVPADQVHLGAADEAGDEQVARGAVKLQRAAHLLDVARAQHHDLVGHGHRLDLVVGDVDHRGLQPLVQLAISSRMPTRSAASRFDSGSSNRNAAGSRTMARPMATRWRWPPDSCPGRRSR